MPTTTIVNLSQRNFNNGLFTTASRATPVGFMSLTITLSPTTGNPATPFQGIANPFNSTSQHVTFGIHWSWDGGTTFPESTESTMPGSPTGQWLGAKGSMMTPQCELGLPFNVNLGGQPTAYRAYANVVGGPVTSGLLVQETTG